MGSQIGIFDYGYSTVWKFCLTDIRKTKNAALTIWVAYNFDFLEKFHIWNVKTPQKFNTKSYSNSQNGSFLGFKMTKIDFTYIMSGRKILKFPNCVFPIRLPRSVTACSSDEPLF